VLKEIDPLLGTGLVRIEREEWRAESIDHTKIAQDTLVEVVSVSGTRVLVKRHSAPIVQ
jgi:inner membrane protein